MTIAGLSGKRVIIIGMAREGKALAQFLTWHGAAVTITDAKDADELREVISELEDLPIRFVLGGHPEELLNADLICVSPGVPLNIPFLVKARRAGIPLSSEPRLFAQFCPAPVIGITGSSGKSTTVVLVGRMLAEAGWQTYVGGNIGAPLLPKVEEIQAGDRVVTELSSFQLELFGTKYGAEEGWSPSIAAITNLTPNHLDRHGTMDAYVAAKKNVFLHQNEDGHVVLSRDNAAAWELRNECLGQVIAFSLEREVVRGSYLRDDRLYVRIEGQAREICRMDEIKLLGRHNVANVLAACAIAGVAGAPAEAMRAVATTMVGIGHRLEFVREHQGVRYYNDSVATSPERAMAALRAFDEPVVLLAGGRDKHLPWDAWADLALEKARHLVVFGEVQPIVERAIATVQLKGQRHLRESLWMRSVETLGEAVAVAASLARPGEVVLLSPGGTSFDEFKDFAERGDRFRMLVQDL